MNLFHEVPVPPRTQSVALNVGVAAVPGYEEHMVPITLSRSPMNKPPLRINRQDLISMRDALGAQGIVSCVNALLLQQHVLIHSSRVERLVPATEVLLSLMFPLKWVLPYIPYLPESFSPEQMLTSPVPILVGMRSECFERVKFNDVFAVNIDNGKITAPMTAPDLRPMLRLSSSPATCATGQRT